MLPTEPVIEIRDGYELSPKRSDRPSDRRDGLDVAKGRRSRVLLAERDAQVWTVRRRWAIENRSIHGVDTESLNQRRVAATRRLELLPVHHEVLAAADRLEAVRDQILEVLQVLLVSGFEPQD